MSENKTERVQMLKATGGIRRREMKQLLSTDRIHYLMTIHEYYEPYSSKDSLKPRTRKVLQEVLLDGKTLTQVGESLGISLERVRQILAGGFRQLLSFDERMNQHECYDKERNDGVHREDMGCRAERSVERAGI